MNQIVQLIRAVEIVLGVTLFGMVLATALRYRIERRKLPYHVPFIAVSYLLLVGIDTVAHFQILRGLAQPDYAELVIDGLAFPLGIYALWRLVVARPALEPKAPSTR